MRLIRLQVAFIASASVGAVFLSLAAGCSQQPASSPDQAAKASPAETQTVKVVRPQKKDVRRLIERPGYNIEAFERTPLYAKIAGYVLKWNADIGDVVHKNDVLAELSIPEMDVELKQKEAAILQAASQVEQADAAKLKAKAELKHAESQYERLARVGRSGVLDKEQVDETRYTFEAGQAAVAKAEADVNVARARLEVAKADRDYTQALLQYTKVRAPFDGVVTRRSINTGDFVQPAAANKSESLFAVEKIRPVRVFINVPEMDAVWVRDGDVALIRVQSLQGQEFKGTVTRASKSLQPQNRTLRTEIDLPNTDGRLLPGMYVNATIVAEHKNVWALPEAAVLAQGDDKYCYFIENGKALRTPVQVGLSGGGLVEITKKKVLKAENKESWGDFTGNEEIINDAKGVTEGQQVTIAAQRD
jgi:RND family efflux transporter MFP subunit